MRRALLSLALLGAVPARAEPVLLISIDGLRSGDVIEAEARGLKVPNLRRFLAEGTWANAVRGVLPTLTYPSHTTLITGVSPARHGVVNNLTFDPTQINQAGWYWYAPDIKVPTLWDAAAKGGLSVGNVHWPVSVGARSITWNLPQYWRTGHADDATLLDILATPGLVSSLEKTVGESYAPGIDEGVAADENRARFAEALIAAKKPAFLTVYLASLDHQEHADGPGSPEANAVLERLDAVVGALVSAEQAAHKDAVIALVSDHGFEPISHETSLYHAFVDAGLIRLDAGGKIASWDAMVWNSGGSAAVVLARPDDAALATRVEALLEQLRDNPALGIAAIAGKERIAALGGNPRASFYVDFVPGTSAAGFYGPSTPLSGTPRNKGTHGYFPDAPNLKSTFMIMGKGVPRGKPLGEIDMRAIAPTLARILKVKFDSAELPPLKF